jgi:hypothetical protein
MSESQNEPAVPVRQQTKQAVPESTRSLGAMLAADANTIVTGVVTGVTTGIATAVAVSRIIKPRGDEKPQPPQANPPQ